MKPRHRTFDNFVTTVGTNGTMTFPLRDASNAGIPTLKVGPLFRRNGIRFFVKMPTLEEAARLPAPLQVDRSTVTFEPVLIYIGGPLPPHCTAKFHRIMCGRQRGKINKKPIHLWNPLEDTSIFPASALEIPALRPEEALEFEGVSYWFNARPPRAGQRVNANPFTYPLPPQPPPDILSQHPVQLMLLVRMKWLPKEVRKKQFRVVQGSPVDASSPAVAMSPEAPAPEILKPSRES